MKTKSKKVIIGLCAFFIVQGLYAQNANTTFEYDKSGNCMVKQKTIVLPASSALRSAAHTEETEEETATGSIAETTGIIEPEVDVFGTNEIHIYPNPTHGQLQIKWIGDFPDTSPQIIVSDSNGRYLQMTDMTNTDFLLDLSAYPAGVYFLRIRSGETVKDWKIIKQ
ncbi:hypothetical protein FACS189413_10420 [Bacteroidia bacterium]|nr:hypothetical protein FACS189413_10420 [Bacteroidia bacterium]